MIKLCGVAVTCGHFEMEIWIWQRLATSFRRLKMKVFAKNWRYNNSYVDENDSFKHSKWISFMDKRLRSAKNLLADANTGYLNGLNLNSDVCDKDKWTTGMIPTRTDRLVSLILDMYKL